MLPPFCKYTIYFRDKVPGGGDAQQIARWRATLGPSFEHLHHYCFGTMKTNRAVLLARDAQVRTFYLGDALKEYDYVITRVPEDFVLLPEIFTKKGENLVRLNRGPLAVVEFERAAALRPDYWPSFAQLSDYYKQQGDLRKAREVLERGIASAPNAVALNRRMEELQKTSGGKAVSAGTRQ